MSLFGENLSYDLSRHIIIVCGPTASGKTDFAHNLAHKYNGEIVNGDSIQIYNNIPILTASPSFNFQKELPYHLYNFISINQEFSVIKYIELATKKIKEIYQRGKLPIIVGGTGMYINALIYGYNEIPHVPKEIRKSSMNLHNKIGQQEFYNNLIEMDPLSLRLNPNDQQRVLRAHEVFMMTKQSIFSFYNKKIIIPLPDFKFEILFLNPERQFLYSLCNMRLKEIFSKGAINEVQFIQENFENIKTSAMKAIGMQEIINFLKNKITIDEAINLAQAKTRQYAKRQITWFNNQLKEKKILKYSNIEEFEILKKNF